MRLMGCVIQGIPGVPSQGPVKEAARELCERFQGDVEKAVDAAAELAGKKLVR